MMSVLGSQLAGVFGAKVSVPLHQVGRRPVGSVPANGTPSRLSSAYIRQPRAICLLLFMQGMDCAFILALPNAGSSIAAKIAMMAMTTSSSISVKPAFEADRKSVV